jgi:hypothetical protein
MRTCGSPINLQKQCFELAAKVGECDTNGMGRKEGVSTYRPRGDGGPLPCTIASQAHCSNHKGGTL